MRVLRSGICLGVIACLGFAVPAAAEGLPDALARAYQTNPLLNAERARQREGSTDRRSTVNHAQKLVEAIEDKLHRDGGEQ